MNSVDTALDRSVFQIGSLDDDSKENEAELDGVLVNLIHLDDLKRNKQASGRLKDRLDLEQLP